MESEKDKPSSPPFTSSNFLATSFSPTFVYSLFYPAVNLNAKFSNLWSVMESEKAKSYPSKWSCHLRGLQMVYFLFPLTILQAIYRPIDGLSYLGNFFSSFYFQQVPSKFLLPHFCLFSVLSGCESQCKILKFVVGDGK